MVVSQISEYDAFVKIIDNIFIAIIVLFDTLYPLCFIVWIIMKRSIRLQAAVKRIRQCLTNSQSGECSEDFLPPHVLADEKFTLLSAK